MDSLGDCYTANVLIQRNASLFKGIDRYDEQMLLALKQSSVRYPKSAYGKAAAVAFGRLQDLKAPVEPRRYLAGG